MKKLLTITLVLLMALPAIAVDYWGGPPEGAWNRGEPGSTYEHYTFDQALPAGPCPVFDNVFGEPMYELMGGFEFGEWPCPPELNPSGFVNGWHCIDETGGSIVLSIPNTEFIDGDKKIFIQITSSKGPSDVSVSGMGESVDGYTVEIWPTGLPQIQWPDPAPYGGVWYTYNYGFVIRPNPQMETITITVPYCTVIDQIVVDTICTGTVPAEQSTLDGVKALFR